MKEEKKKIIQEFSENSEKAIESGKAKSAVATNAGYNGNTGFTKGTSTGGSYGGGNNYNNGANGYNNGGNSYKKEYKCRSRVRHP